MSDTKVLGYTTGPIPATSALTAAFIMHVSECSGSLQAMMNNIEQDRRAMMDYDSDNRISLADTGMYIKYLPARLISSASNTNNTNNNQDNHQNLSLQTGGAYLFTTPAACAQYAAWTTHSFRDPTTGVAFWDRPMFHDIRRWVWDVVGAHNLAPAAATAQLGRMQHFSYRIESSRGDSTAAVDGVGEALKQAYPKLLDAAAAEKQRTAVAFWLLHAPSERLIATHFIASREAGEDVNAAVARLGAMPSFAGEVLREQLKGIPGGVQIDDGCAFDRTSPFLQNWLPVSRAAGGATQCAPNFPALPRVTL